MASKANALTDHYQELLNRLAAASFTAMVADTIFERTAKQYSQHVSNPIYKNTLFTGHAITLREDRPQKYDEYSEFIKQFPAANCTVNFPNGTRLFKEMNAQLQLAEIVNAYEAWEEFIRQALAVFLFQKRNAKSPLKSWVRKLASPHKNTPHYFHDIARVACKHNSREAVAYLSRHVSGIAARATNYLDANLYDQLSFVEELRHTKVHANGIVSLKARETNQLKFIDSLSDISVIHNECRVFLNAKLCESLIERVAEFGRVVYQSISDECGFAWVDDWESHRSRGRKAKL